MKLILGSLLALFILQEVVGPPVTHKKTETGKTDEENNEVGGNEQDLGDAIEYNRYLKEVVSALESDPEFREKLEKAEEVDIRTGKIAHELEYVNHHVRSKLDELKRQELERLRHFANKEYELRNDIDTDHLKISPEHVDHGNPNTFEIEDLRKLIAKTTADLAEVDKKRREDFKEYEMQKEFEKQEKLKELDDEHKKAMEHDLEEQEQKHKKHEPLHHPGSKQQLEEVWEKQDHMENQDFDPKTFFHLHDLDGNGVWDESEVKALFLKELDKLYNSGAPEDDMRERAEEMERMREHVFQEADVNKDGLISYQEFLAQTQKPEFEKDEGWDGIDQQEVYSQKEYEEFERRRQAEVQRMIAQGLIPPHPNAMPPPHGYQQGMPNQQQQHFQGQVPQYHPSQVPQGQFHPNQVPQGQFHPNQVPQGQFHPNQVPQGQFQGQVPQGQFHPNQVPQYHPGQVGQGQQHQGQIPPAQFQHASQAQPNQIPPAQHPAQINNQQARNTNQNQVPQAQNVHPNQGQVPPAQHPAQVNNQQAQNVHQNQVPQAQNVHQNQVPQAQNVHPNQGQIPQAQNVHPNQGQIPQAQNVHQNQVPQAQNVAANQVQSNQPPQGHVNPETTHKAANNENTVNVADPNSIPVPILQHQAQPVPNSSGGT